MRTQDTKRVGQFRSRVTWKTPPDTPDGEDPTFANSATDYDLWGDYATVHCEITTLRGRELPDAKAEVSETYKNVRQHWGRATVPDTTMVGLHVSNGVTKKYQVKSVNDIGERRKTVDVTVVEII